MLAFTWNLRKDDHSVVNWQCLDQILVSPDLAEQIDAVNILDRLGDTVLLAPERASMDDAYGDHLPVELTLKDEEEGE